MGRERTGKGGEGEREGKERGRGKGGFKGGKGAMPPNMLKVSFLCTFAYGVHIQSCRLKLPLPQALNSMYHEVMMQKAFAGASIHCK